jgi:predicted AAA+ superfamily ATPase/ribosomal protein L37AE/L43A
MKDKNSSISDFIQEVVADDVIKKEEVIGVKPKLNPIVELYEKIKNTTDISEIKKLEDLIYKAKVAESLNNKDRDNLKKFNDMAKEEVVAESSKETVGKTSPKLINEYTSSSQRFKTVEDYKKHIQNGGKLFDYIVVDGLLFTMEEYDASGHEVTYANKTDKKTVHIEWANRYEDMTDITDIYMDDMYSWRDDISYADEIKDVSKKSERVNIDKENIATEDTFDVVDPDAISKDKIRSITMSMYTSSKEVNYVSEEEVNIAIYWTDSWEGIFTKTLKTKAETETLYNSIKLKLAEIHKLIADKKLEEAGVKTKEFLSTMKSESEPVGTGDKSSDSPISMTQSSLVKEEARTIGPEWKKEVKRLVYEANASGIDNNDEVFEYVKEKLPLEVFDTWESAHDEIDNLCSDYNMADDKPKRAPWLSNQKTSLNKKSSLLTKLESIHKQAAIEGMQSVNRSYSGFLVPVAQYALTELIKAEDPRIINNGKSFSDNVEIIDIPVDTNKIASVINNSLIIYPHMVIQSNQHYQDWSISCFAKTREAAMNWMEKFETKMLKENQYRGKCLHVENGNVMFHGVPKISWDDVVLEEGIKKDIKMNTVSFLGDVKLAGVGVNKRGLVMYGPPGSGKTSACKAIFNELEGKNVSRVYVTAESFRRMSAGSLFDLLPYLGKTVLAFEDIDMISGNRNEVFVNNNLLGDLLTNMDGMRDYNEPVVILASTNKIALLDEALSSRPGRFDRKIEIGLPTEASLKMLYKKFSDIDVTDEIIKLSKDFTGAHVRETVNTAKILARHEDKTILECMKASCQIIRDNFFPMQTIKEIKLASFKLMQKFAGMKKAEKELCPECKTELEHITKGKEDVFGCPKCKKEVKRDVSKKEADFGKGIGKVPAIKYEDAVAQGILTKDDMYTEKGMQMAFDAWKKDNWSIIEKLWSKPEFSTYQEIDKLEMRDKENGLREEKDYGWIDFYLPEITDYPENMLEPWVEGPELVKETKDYGVLTDAEIEKLDLKLDNMVQAVEKEGGELHYQIHTNKDNGITTVDFEGDAMYWEHMKDISDEFDVSKVSKMVKKSNITHKVEPVDGKFYVFTYDEKGNKQDTGHHFNTEEEANKFIEDDKKLIESGSKIASKKFTKGDRVIDSNGFSGKIISEPAMDVCDVMRSFDNVIIREKIADLKIDEEDSDGPEVAVDVVANKKAEEIKGDEPAVIKENKIDNGIPGGMAEHKKLTEDQVDPKQLAKGIEIEMEHTDDKNVAKEIALDHLSENPKYYLPYLEDAENKAKDKGDVDEKFVEDYNKEQKERLEEVKPIVEEKV